MRFSILDVFGLRDRPPRERRDLTEPSERPRPQSVRPAPPTGKAAGNAGGKTVDAMGRPMRRPRAAAKRTQGKAALKRASRTRPKRPKAVAAGRNRARTARGGKSMRSRKVARPQARKGR